MNSPYVKPARHSPSRNNDQGPYRNPQAGVSASIDDDATRQDGDPGSGPDLAFLDKAGEDFVKMFPQGSVAIGLWVAGSVIAAATAAALKAFRS